MRNSKHATLRLQLTQACAEPRTRAQLFDALGGKAGVGRQRFQNLLQAMLNAGDVQRAGEIANPLHGHGRNNNPTVLLFRAREGA